MFVRSLFYVAYPVCLASVLSAFGCSWFPGTSSTLRTSTQPQRLTFGSIPRSSCAILSCCLLTVIIWIPHHLTTILDCCLPSIIVFSLFVYLFSLNILTRYCFQSFLHPAVTERSHQYGSSEHQHPHGLYAPQCETYGSAAGEHLEHRTHCPSAGGTGVRAHPADPSAHLSHCAHRTACAARPPGDPPGSLPARAETSGA